MLKLFSRRPEYGIQWGNYQLPGTVPPQTICCARVELQNTGAGVWRSTADAGGRTDFLVYLDGVVAGTFPLPAETVPPRGRVGIDFTFRSPSRPGIHTLKCDLVEQNVTRFEDQGSEPLILEFAVAGPAADPPPQTGAKARRVSGLPPYGLHVVDYDLPGNVRAGDRFCARVCLENRGTVIWRSGPAIRNSADLAVFVDNRCVATVHLPLPEVRIRQRVNVHFAIPAPENPGRHQLKVDLVIQDVTLFEQQGIVPLTVEFETQGPASPTGRVYEKALRMNPWFYRPTGGISQSRDRRGFPVLAARAKGCHLWDTDGRRYIDFTMGWGSALLGYANDRIQKAMTAAMESGAILPFPHPLMVEVSEMLCAEIPCAQMVAFGKNGSDVCMLAVRLARRYTGRHKVLVCGYHGFHDWFAELKGFAESGVPDRPEPLVYPFRFNDYGDFKALLDRHGNDLAAVMLEPSGPAEDVQGPRQDASAEFLARVAADTRRIGAVLIYDEIITGFRSPQGSVQKATGIIPDLACFGKALGAGAPISALAGSGEILSQAMAHSFYGPTFKDETYSLAAAREALAIYRSEPVAEQVEDFGTRLKEQVNGLCRSLDLPAAMMGPAFRFALIFKEDDPLLLTKLRTLYHQELLKGGIITYNGIMLPSYAHDRDAFEQTVDAIAGSLKTVQRALRDDTVDHCIEIPLLVP